MIQIMSSNGEVQYGVNDYVIDFDSELDQIVRAEAGSTAYSIESGTTFIKDNSNKWNVFTNNSGGGGSTPELPDNIIASYDMEYNEFWDAYNEGNLTDGLYCSTLYDALVPVEVPIDYNLASWGQEALSYNGYAWIYAYADSVLLQVNEYGEIVRYKNLKDIVPDRDIHCDKGLKSMIVDKFGYLYIGAAYDEVFVVNTDDITNNDNWKIINPNIYDINTDEGWTFSIVDSYCGSTDLLIVDGGSFAYYPNDSKIAYFKNGDLITQVTNLINPSLATETIAVNYLTNKLYRVYFEGDETTWTGQFKLYEFDIDGTYNTYTLNNTFTFNNCNIDYFQVDCRQMFIRNDIIYIQFVIDNVLYYFLFDTITNSVIQEQQVFTPLENCQLWGYDGVFYNDIYHDTNFSISYLRCRGQDETIENSFNHRPFFIKINYKDEATFAEIIYLNNKDIFSFDSYRYVDLLIKRCNKNGQYLYADNNYKLHLFSLRDYSDIETPQAVKTITFGKRMTYPNVQNSADFFITSYEVGPKIGCIRIDAATGNVISKVNNITDSPNEEVREYVKEKNLILFGNNVINIETLNIDYSTDSDSLGNPCIVLNNRQLYNTQNSINYLGEGKLSTSYLIHKNNIILEKVLKEK